MLKFKNYTLANSIPRINTEWELQLLHEQSIFREISLMTASLIFTTKTTTFNFTVGLILQAYSGGEPIVVVNHIIWGLDAWSCSHPGDHCMSYKSPIVYFIYAALHSSDL